jgi:hypothetical protein
MQYSKPTQKIEYLHKVPGSMSFFFFFLIIDRQSILLIQSIKQRQFKIHVILTCIHHTCIFRPIPLTQSIENLFQLSRLLLFFLSFFLFFFV